MLQDAAACCSLLQCVAIGCNSFEKGLVVQDIAARCVAVCCSVLQCRRPWCATDCNSFEEVFCRMLQCVAVSCSELQYVAINVLQCAAV